MYRQIILTLQTSDLTADVRSELWLLTMWSAGSDPDRLQQEQPSLDRRCSSIWNRETVTVCSHSLKESNTWRAADSVVTSTTRSAQTVSWLLSDWLLDYKKICVNERSDDECVKSLWSFIHRRQLVLRIKTLSRLFNQHKRKKNKNPAGFLLQISSAWR